MEFKSPSSLPRVLLVEDSAEFSLILATWLRSHFGADVTQVGDGDEAANRIRYQQWDAIVVDIELPGRDGASLAAMSKAIDPATPVLMVTAHKKIEYTLSALEHHVDGFLFKPFTKDTFLEQVQKIFDARRYSRIGRSARRVLAIGAHPDDVEIGCGGALALHGIEGDQVSVLTLSLGARGGDAMTRTDEAQRAAGIINARLFLGDLVDTQISEGPETIEKIAQVIDEVNPTHVYTHSGRDAHQDHRSVYHASIVASRKVENVYCYQAPSSTVAFQPNVFIEVTRSFELKVAMIEAYASQVACRDYLNKDLIRATARYWGRFCGYGLAEPMEVYKQKNS